MNEKTKSITFTKTYDMSGTVQGTLCIFEEK